MPRPGADVFISDAVAPGGAELNTGTAFMAGATERGPVDQALKIGSVARYRQTYGARPGGSLLFDAVSAFFSEGGTDLYISRLAADDAAPAEIAFGDGLNALAKSPGDWGNRVSLAARAPGTFAEQVSALGADPLAAGDPIVIEVSLDDVVTERSSVLATTDAAVSWAASRSNLVELEKVTDELPDADTTVDLAGGANGGAWTADDIEGALDRFEHGFGPGQVLIPGATDRLAYDALCAHCDRTRRVALLDAPDTPDPLTLANAVTDLRDVAGVRMVAMFGPWAIYPGEVAPATTVVPYSGVQAGLIARVDRAGNPNAPAAGADGIARLAVDLSQNYTDAEREALNEAGVCLAKIIYGDVRTYGYRTAAGPEVTNWLWFGNSRTIMALSFECEAVAEKYVLKQIDGRRQIFSRLNKDLAGVCARFYDMNALYGETPEEAYLVNTGPGINTIETIAAGEIHAEVRVKVSPAAEWVVVHIVKVPVERPIAA